MPLVNIIGVKRKAWNKEPENFITGDCAEIQKDKEYFLDLCGKILFFERRN